MAKKVQLKERGTNVNIYPVTIKEAVGLGNVDNTSDANKPISTAQAAKFSEIEGKLDSHLQNATSGLNHVPSGGKDKQVLTWQADGKAYWETLSNILPGVENLLAYGVEWKDNVADPHLTRIGNMSLHKTLPIQSQLKGCIAQKDKVMYWLDENDWRFRKNPEIITVDLSNGATTFTVPSVVGLAVGQYLRYQGCIAKIDSISTENTTITVKWETVDETDLTNITQLDVGSRLDGYDGTVRVYCPSFYIKSQIIGNTRRVWLSTVKIDSSWTYQPEILVDAYRSTVLNTVPENMGYLSTLPVNSAISVVNTATYCRGGKNRTDYDKYLTGADGTTIDIFRTDLGKPRTIMSRATMRTYSRNAGSEMLSYDQYKNIFYWLYVVEYANFNCQEAYNEVLTEEGYHQGGMGPGVTGINGSNQQFYNAGYPLTPCGYCNNLGNGTGIKAMTLATPAYPGGKPTQSHTFQVPRWRGFDNPFGDIMTNLDGIIIDTDTHNHPNNMNYVYTCQDPSKYADSLNDGYKKVGEEIHEKGYTKLFDLGEAAHIIPNVMGGNTTLYKCDEHVVDNWNAALRTLDVGGIAENGADAGLGSFNSDRDVSDSSAAVGFRTVSRSVSFFQSK